MFTSVKLLKKDEVNFKEVTKHKVEYIVFFGEKIYISSLASNTIQKYKKNKSLIWKHQNNKNNALLTR